MKLYGFWRSTATWRVRIALAHKGIAYTYVPVHLRREGGEQNRAEFEAVNPMRQVPVLELTGDEARDLSRDESANGSPVRLTQSVAILELLEERFPEPPLLPRGLFARAQARRIAETINAGIQPLQNTGVQLYVESQLHADGAAWIHHWVGKGLRALEAMVAESAGRFCVGDAVSVADLFVVPQLYFARRFTIDLTPFPTLVRVDAACAALPAFVQAHAENQPDRE